MINKPSLHITWAKGFGEIYCHHATLFIPCELSLFSPDSVYVGISVRNNMVKKGVILNSFDTKSYNYLPYVQTEGGIKVPLNSAYIVEALGLNSWTKLKGNVRGSQKSFPINMFYRNFDGELEILPFSIDEGGSPYMRSEHLFGTLRDGDKVDIIINF